MFKKKNRNLGGKTTVYLFVEAETLRVKKNNIKCIRLCLCKRKILELKCCCHYHFLLLSFSVFFEADRQFCSMYVQTKRLKGQDFIVNVYYYSIVHISVYGISICCMVTLKMLLMKMCACEYRIYT